MWHKYGEWKIAIRGQGMMPRKDMLALLHFLVTPDQGGDGTVGYG